MIPLATTRLTFVKPTAGGDPYENATTATVATGVAAHISAPTGREQAVGGQQERVDAIALYDPTPGVDHYCTVLDETTGERWEIAWLRTRIGLGLDHVRAGLLAVKGGSNG